MITTMLILLGTTLIGLRSGRSRSKTEVVQDILGGAFIFLAGVML